MHHHHHQHSLHMRRGRLAAHARTNERTLRATLGRWRACLRPFSAATALRSLSRGGCVAGSAAEGRSEPRPRGLVFVVRIVARAALEAPHHLGVVRPAEHVELRAARAVAPREPRCRWRAVGTSRTVERRGVVSLQLDACGERRAQLVLPHDAPRTTAIVHARQGRSVCVMMGAKGEVCA
jgi:hypothetical protein